jgi:two-component system nitrate/nitrite sensor histidine kinase NarX
MTMKGAIWFWMGAAAVAILIGGGVVGLPGSGLFKGLWLAFGLLSGGALFVLWRQNQETHRQAQELEKQLQVHEDQSLAKYENIVRISQRFATATDETQILNGALELMLELINARAASFTFIDELGATLNTRVQGELPPGVSKDWLEYLSSPSIRKKCPHCQQSESRADQCPLLYGSQDQLHIYCVPIQRLGQELGIFHLFLSSDTQITREQDYLLRLISDQTALALEGARLRSREAHAHLQLEAVKQNLDVGFFIDELLKGLAHGLGIQTAIVSVWDHHLKKPIKEFSFGIISAAQKDQIYAVLSRRNLARLEKTRVPLTLEIDGVRSECSLLNIPVPFNRRDLRGIVQIVAPGTQELSSKQEEMLNAIVTQISFLLQNANLLAEVEIKAILQERIRLAREIHDGLAQTLGFLKLKISQLRAYLEQGETERASQTTQLLHEAISDAYIEARHAIDQLRISIYDAPLAELLQETLDEFRESSGIPAECAVEPPDLRLPVEINAQLVRIIQESLSNIRKHAHAHQVQIQTAVKNDWLILEVRDDGVGFQPDEVSRHSQYGLRGMQERAEMIGAELQIISQPNQGATVQIRLPLYQLERSWQT